MIKRKFGVFISAGLGDAILLVPLIKRLNKIGSVTGLFDSNYNCQELFYKSNLFDNYILLDNPVSYIKTLCKYHKKFDVVYLNYFSSNRKNIFLSIFLANEVRSNNQNHNLFGIGKNTITYKTPIPDIHEGLQNIRLSESNITLNEISELDFRIDYLNTNMLNQNLLNFKDPFFTIQISSANNQHQFKNWPISYWKKFIKLITKVYPNYQIVLIGDKNETSLIKQILNNEDKNVHSLIGQTSISDLIGIIQNSLLFIGLDGGPMHIAASQGVPTFTIWGGSNYKLYGYQNINNVKHKIIHKKLACHPCNSWINPNTSKVTNPNNCPDYECLNSLTPEFAFSKIEPFVNQILKTS